MTVCYARIEQAQDFLMLGWLPSTALAGTHHGEWAILFSWICGCKARVPA